jgi:predicted kinase
MTPSAKLIFLCGKMAAGKSTLAKYFQPPADEERFNVIRHVRD